MKITVSEYKIPEIIPLQWVRTLTSGANQPMVVRGIQVGGSQSAEYVLKYRGAERMTETACRRELLAAWMATEMDIAVPEPVLIQVDANFSQTVSAQWSNLLATKALGTNFGNRFIEGKAAILRNGQISSEFLQVAARIFVFDLLIQNSDRRPEKPNAFVADGKIYVIDHELAFSFLSMLPMFTSSNPWILHETDIFAAKGHLFYPTLQKAKGINWEAALSTVQQLTPQFWRRVNELLPEAWQNKDELSRIQIHIEGIQQHSATFISEIWNKLIG